MHLLLTRGAEDAARTRPKLEAAGHTVLVGPVIRFEPITTPWPRRPPHGLIATSARAFCALAREAPDWDVEALPLFLVGQRTQEAAQAAGFRGPALVAPDSATLTTRLRAHKAMRLLFLVGEDRKTDIEQGLIDSQHRLSVIETYRAEAMPCLNAEAVAAMRDGLLDGVMHYSQRSAALFVALSAEARVDIRFLKHICLSADVAAPLYQAECTAITQADAPNEAAMMAALAGC